MSPNCMEVDDRGWCWLCVKKVLVQMCMIVKTHITVSLGKLWFKNQWICQGLMQLFQVVTKFLLYKIFIRWPPDYFTNYQARVLQL